MRLESISQSEAARYMGVRGEATQQVQSLLDKAEKNICELISPKYVYRSTELNFTNNGIYIDQMQMPLTGVDIAKHLNGCKGVILFAATLTADADKLIRQAGVNDMAYALALDCMCSAAIEKVCDIAENEIFTEIKSAYRTWRFSPGYGDFPLNIQNEFLRYLNASRRIGLTATENSLLVPSKSVTAVIGYSDIPIEKGARKCAVCNMRENCAFAANGGCNNR